MGYVSNGFLVPLQLAGVHAHTVLSWRRASVSPTHYHMTSPPYLGGDRCCSCDRLCSSPLCPYLALSVFCSKLVSVHMQLVASLAPGVFSGTSWRPQSRCRQCSHPLCHLYWQICSPPLLLQCLSWGRMFLLGNEYTHHSISNLCECVFIRT